jgi:hypothetical protein
MEVFLFILSFMSGGVILTVAYTTYITNTTKSKQDKLAFMQEQLIDIQKQQFEKFDVDYNKQKRELVDIRSRMEGDQYRDLASTNQRISKEVTKLDLLILDIKKMDNEHKGVINTMRNDIQSRLVAMEKTIGNELRQNY